MHSHPSTSHDRRALATLCLAALGVVYGDIGTSPLYTWNEIQRTGTLTGPADVLGATSLVVWTLTLAISVKYAWLVLRADNHGEGGTFALMGLLHGNVFPGKTALLAALTFAACLLYADGLLTPAISVVSAAEGLVVIDERLEPLVVPFSLVVLTALFSMQRFGTERVGRVFGLVCLVWFLVIGGLGLGSIARTPGVLAALSPHHAVLFLVDHAGPELLPVLGAVVLAITGGEALFADIGHFGVRAVRLTWSVLVYPALLASYLGQGAALYSGVELREGNVFYTLVPDGFVGPMIALSTAAAVLASQALISGAFSLTRSAINLGLVPRTAVLHTNAIMEGQIYLPTVNWALWFGCCALVVQFRSSAGLAGAYGLAVMGVVFTTTIAVAVIARARWGWSRRRTAAVFVPFLAFDGLYLFSNVVKIPDGAWVPLVFATVLFAAMYTWRDGRVLLKDAYRALPTVPLSTLVSRRAELAELPRAFVFLVSTPVSGGEAPTPVLLAKFVDRYGAIPRHLTLFTVVQESAVPFWREDRFRVFDCGAGIVSVQMRVGYMEQPDVRSALTWLKTHRKIRIHAHRWTIVTGLEELLVEPGAPLRLRLLAFAMRYSAQVHRWFGLDADTGVSKEVIPVRVTSRGEMKVVVRGPTS